MIGIDIDATVTRGGFTLATSLRVMEGERVGVIGANGSGKTTLLSALAGHIPITSGYLRVHGTTVDNGHGRPKTWVPPHRRGLGWLGPSARVFPHMTVRANVAYGLKASRFDEVDERTSTVLADFHLNDIADHMASRLSTGQQCRTALARAFAVEPRVLVMDEPFSGLDVRAACEIRSLVDPIIDRGGTTLIMASHDLVDLVSLVSRVVLLDHGTILDDGDLDRVLGRPRSEFVSDLAGTTVLDGVVTDDGIETPLGLIDTDQSGYRRGTKVRVAIPQDGVHLQHCDDSPTTVTEVSMSVSGLVVLVEGRYRLHCPVTDLTSMVKPGERIAVSIDQSRVSVFN